MKAKLAVLVGLGLCLLAVGLVLLLDHGSSKTQPLVSVQPPPNSNGHFISFGASPAPVVGDTLTATNGQWSGSPTGYTYQLLDCGAVVPTAGRARRTPRRLASELPPIATGRFWRCRLDA
jgi:hypothetical protein